MQLVKETNLFLGYNGSPTNSALNNYHSLEVSLYKSSFTKYRHMAGSSFYLTQELGIVSDTFIHGTKLGLNLYAMGIIFGTELTYHTDYDKQAFAFSPYLGFGGNPFRLTFAWRAKLGGKDFRALSPLNVNLSMKVFNLKTSEK